MVYKQEYDIIEVGLSNSLLEYVEKVRDTLQENNITKENLINIEQGISGTYIHYWKEIEVGMNCTTCLGKEEDNVSRCKLCELSVKSGKQLLWEKKSGVYVK